MNALARDIRYALRQLGRNPSFAVVAVLTIALGIAATTTAYGTITVGLARRIPVRDIDRVVGLWSFDRSNGKTGIVVSPADFVAWRDRQRSFEGLAAQRLGGVNLAGVDQPARPSAAFVSASYFDVMGMRPIIGREFTSDENAPGRAPVAILSDRFWRSQFDGRATVIGQTVVVNGRSTTIVGVMPPDDFSPAILLPLTIDSTSSSYQQRALRIAARLKPGVTLGMAQTEMTGIASQLEHELPETHQGWGVTARPYRVEFIAPGEEIVFALLGLAALAVLMIGCANIAGLLLARGTARSQEMLIRSALGASRGRLIRQTLAEGLVLASAGALLGVVLAFEGLRLLVTNVFPDGVPAYAAGHSFLNGGLLVFTVGATLCSAVFFALIPALHAAPADAGALGGGVRTTSPRSSQRLRSVFITSEVAGTVVLLAMATLFLRTAVNLRSIEPGFDTRNLLLMKVALPETDDGVPPNAAGFYDKVVERLKASPGVVAAGAAQRVPVEGNRLNPNRNMVIEGRPTGNGETRVVDDVTVTAGYLETLRVRLREGRLLTRGDGASAPLVAVISETTARRYWGRQSPIGAHVRLGDEPSGTAWRRVVGVVGDVRNDDIDTPPSPNVYIPAAQRPTREMTFMVRVTDAPLAHVDAARRAVAAEDPNLPVFNLRSMDQLLAEDLQGMQMLSAMTTTFAALALLLATVGIYGMVAYNVAQRTREIAVRIAVGARTHHIVRHVLGRGLTAVVAGMAIGLVVAAGVSRVLKIVLYGVSPGDPSTYAVVTLILLGAAMLACAVPARRILGLNPVVALRHE